MKILQFTENNLSDREFDVLCKKIIASFYDYVSGISDIYKIHIDYINDVWYVEFVPKSTKIPVIKVDTQIVYNNAGKEILKIIPKQIIKFPSIVRLDDYDDAVGYSSIYSTIMDIVVELYDFEYQL